MNAPPPIKAYTEFVQSAVACMQAAALESDPAQAICWITGFLAAHGLTPAPAMPEEHYSAHASGIDIRRIVGNRNPSIGRQVTEATGIAMQTGQPHAVAAVAVGAWLRQHRPPYTYGASVAPSSFHHALAALMQDKSARGDVFQDLFGNAESAEWADNTLEKALATAPPQVIETLHEAAHAALTRRGWVEVEEEQQPANAGVFI